MRIYDSAIQFQSIEGAARTTGLSRYFLRRGCHDVSIPHVKSGNKYLINVPLMLQRLNQESESNAQA